MTDPAPNWYPDPADPTQRRWWDGQTWTHHTRPDVPEIPPAHGQPANPDTAERARSGAGRLALLATLAVAAIVLVGGGSLLLMRSGDSDRAAPGGAGVAEPGGEPTDDDGADASSDDETTDTSTPEDSAPEDEDPDAGPEDEDPDGTPDDAEPAGTTTTAPPGDPTWGEFVGTGYSIRVPPQFVVLDETTVEGVYRSDRLAEHLRFIMAMDSAEVLAIIGDSTFGYTLDLFALTEADLDLMFISAAEDPWINRLEEIETNWRYWLSESGVDPAAITIDRILVDGIESSRLRTPVPEYDATIMINYAIPLEQAAIEVIFIVGPQGNAEALAATAEAVVATFRAR